MSFSKAKITRFNDFPVSTPSPAKYDLDIEQKTKLDIYPRSSRSPSSCKGGVHQIQSSLFRTPSFIKKKKLLGFSSKAKLILKQNEKELLQEKAVECKTKDIVIGELTKQLEEFKDTTFSLQQQCRHLVQEKEKFDEEMSNLKKSHSTEIGSLIEKVNLLKEENEKLKNDHKSLQVENEKKIESYKKDLSSKSDILEQRLMEVNRKHNDILELHERELQRIYEKHQEEIQNTNFEMLKCVEDIQKCLDDEKCQSVLKIKEQKKNFLKEIKNLKMSFSSEKELINNQNLARIKQLEENMAEVKVLSEIQNKEKCSELETYWKARLQNQEKESTEILKECQAISEYNVIQCEIEKNDYKIKLETKTLKYQDLEKKYDDIYFQYKKLRTSYTHVQNKLYRVIKQVREMEVTKSQINKFLNEKQTYETTISRCQETIDVLKKRLQESALDIEQLKSELSQNETKLLEYEENLNISLDKLKKAEILIEEFESFTYETNDWSAIKIVRNEIKSIQEELLAKVTEFQCKVHANKEQFKQKMQLKEEDNRELFKLVKKQRMLNANASKLLSETNLELEKLSTEKNDYLYQIETLNTTNTKLQTDITTLVEEKNRWYIEKKELELKIEVLKNELHKLCTQEVNSDQKIKRDQVSEELVEKVSNKNIKMLEMEAGHTSNEYCKSATKSVKGIRTVDELILMIEQHLKNCDSIIKPVREEFLEQESEYLDVLFSELLKSPIHLYIIKFLLHLNCQNQQLLQKNRDLDNKLKTQDKKLEKFKPNKSELNRSFKKTMLEDKENIHSLNRSFKCENFGPLRELN